MQLLRVKSSAPEVLELYETFAVRDPKTGDDRVHFRELLLSMSAMCDAAIEPRVSERVVKQRGTTPQQSSFLHKT